MLPQRALSGQGTGRGTERSLNDRKVPLTSSKRETSVTTTNPGHIAWARPEDAASLVPLLTALHNHDVPGAAEPPPDVVTHHAERLLEPRTPYRLAVAKDGHGVPVGLAAVATFVSISDPRPDHHLQMELKELFVMPSHRGLGLGDALMNWIEEEARAAGVSRIDWHVKKDNLGGIAFYERLGGTVVENRLSMRKQLLR